MGSRAQEERERSDRAVLLLLLFGFRGSGQPIALPVIVGHSFLVVAVVPGVAVVPDDPRRRMIRWNNAVSATRNVRVSHAFRRFLVRLLRSPRTFWIRIASVGWLAVSLAISLSL